MVTALAASAALAIGAGVAAPPARAGVIETALGVPCLPAPGGVRVCTGTLASRVPSWDGVPLDVDITLPPPGREGPYPLIVGLHGFGLTKLLAFEHEPNAPIELAQRGYAVMAYSARGIGLSCGLHVSRTSPGCDRGWLHLGDARYEARDTQHLAGLLVDEGLVHPRRIGVTGSSYGGGQSLMLAALRDRVMLGDGRLVPWTSPRGEPMRIAAAAPRIGWSDLTYAFAPTGRNLDYRSRNPYGEALGIPKGSYLDNLYLVANTGYIAPPGADPEADLQTWKAAIAAGEPYDAALMEHVRHQFSAFRSAYYLLDRPGRSRRWRPAPTLIYNAWTDDIMPAGEALRYLNRVRRGFPGTPVGLVLGAGFAHDRGSLVTEPVLANRERDALFDRHLLGHRTVRPLDGVVTTTQGCDLTPELGPFETATWRAQHPGEVRLLSREAQTFDSEGGDLLPARLTDPFGGASACRTIPAARDRGAATYELEPARSGGFTLVGSPTVGARIAVEGEFPQISVRLWDVAPGGTQTLVQHGSYAPRPSGHQTFQIHPSGWHFAAGHVAKLELLGRDAPYAQPSTGRFRITVEDLVLELPVRQRPDGGQVEAYSLPRAPRP